MREPEAAQPFVPHAGALPRLLQDATMPDGVALASAVDALRGPEGFPRLAGAMAERASDRGRTDRARLGNALRLPSSSRPDA